MSPSELTEELLKSEGKQALKLMADDFIREIYNRTDGTGGVFLVEAATENEVTEGLGTLPMVQKGLLSLDIHGSSFAACSKQWRANKADTAQAAGLVWAFAGVGAADQV